MTRSTHGLRIIANSDPEADLRAAWAEADSLKAKLRAAEANARKIEREVAQTYGYGSFVRREALERAMNARKQ